jgi:chromatin segregation and condensation protein Rec8/ScpA/Scc1 (kleisin family)
VIEKKVKPYYLRQPWDILFRENKLDKISPWSVNLVQLLASLLEEMQRVGIDYRIAGTAVDSSVQIYLKKAEMLVEMGEMPEPQLLADNDDLYLPPALPFPFRFEFTTTSVQDLISALERALQDENRIGNIPRLPTLPIPAPNFLDFDQYLLDIQSRSEEFLAELRARIETMIEDLKLSKLIENMTWIETIRTFMMLLFLAQRMSIDLDQDEEETDIVIKIREGNL